MTQSWVHLLFAHWPVDAAGLRSTLPAGLELDTYEGQAWVSVVPFGIRPLRLRYLPNLSGPFETAFLELNVRTYVTAEGKPGIWFYSLDASEKFAVMAARFTYGLPYFNAKMQMSVDAGNIVYDSRRSDPRIGPGEFSSRYRPTDDVYAAAPGSLDAWLTERYCLYTQMGRTLYRGNIHHVPWPLQPAAGIIQRNTVTQAHGITLPDVSPIMHYAERLDVLVWALERVKE
jgi:uncharacterized protein YqjF (DUF2071 family)